MKHLNGFLAPGVSLSWFPLEKDFSLLPTDLHGAGRFSGINVEQKGLLLSDMDDLHGKSEQFFYLEDSLKIILRIPSLTVTGRTARLPLTQRRQLA